MSVATDEPQSTGGVRVVRSGGVVTATIDRPRRANALDAATVEQLLTVVEDAGVQDTRALVLQGEGRHFCAGFDMTHVLEQSEGDLLLRFVRIEQLLQRLRRAPFLTVACVGGSAVGAGADIVAACSHRLLDPGAILRFPGFRFGVALGTRHLAALVGTQAARALLLESRAVDAAMALELGLGTALITREHQGAQVEEIVAAADALDNLSLTTALARTSTITDADDAFDMAALVSSIARAGLHKRLANYLDRGR